MRHMTNTYYTVPEVADMLKINPVTLRRWIALGKVTAIQLPGGKEYRITSAELERITQSKTVEAA